MSESPTPQPQEPTTRETIARALTFIGPLITVAGALAILRIGKTGERPDLLFAVLMPIGLVVFGVGVVMKWKANQERDSGHG